MGDQHTIGYVVTCFWIALILSVLISVGVFAFGPEEHSDKIYDMFVIAIICTAVFMVVFKLYERTALVFGFAAILIYFGLLLAWFIWSITSLFQSANHDRVIWNYYAETELENKPINRLG